MTLLLAPVRWLLPQGSLEAELVRRMHASIGNTTLSAVRRHLICLPSYESLQMQLSQPDRGYNASAA